MPGRGHRDRAAGLSPPVYGLSGSCAVSMQGQTAVAAPARGAAPVQGRVAVGRGGIVAGWLEAAR